MTLAEEDESPKGCPLRRERTIWEEGWQAEVFLRRKVYTNTERKKKCLLAKKRRQAAFSVSHVRVPLQLPPGATAPRRSVPTSKTLRWRRSAEPVDRAVRVKPGAGAFSGR